MQQNHTKNLKPSTLNYRVQNDFNSALDNQKRGNNAAAKLLYRKILVEMPDHFDSLHMLGLMESQNGDLAFAEKLFERAVNLNPTFAAVHSNRGNLLRSLGRPSQALESFDRAILANPNHAIAHSNRGLVLQEMGRSHEALVSFENAVQIKPDLKEAHFNRGNILVGLSRLDEAIKCFDIAIDLKPDYVSALFNRGNALKEKELFSEALIDYDHVICLSPHHAEAHSNRGMVLHEFGRLSEAIASYTRAIALKSKFAEAYSNRGNSHRLMGDYNAARSDYTMAIEINPDCSDAISNRGILNLMLQQFSAGWSEYEWRSKAGSKNRSSSTDHAENAALFTIQNSASDFTGKTVFIASEQGIGDHIMFMSMLPDILQDAASVICQLDPRLIKIFERCLPHARYVACYDHSILEAVKVDCHIRIASLGYTYRQDIRDFPGTPYLAANPFRVERWQSRLLSEPRKLNVGVSWRGGTRKTNSAERSLLLEQLAPLLDQEDYTFISLQHGDVDAEISAFNANRRKKLLCFPKAEIDDFEDLAGLIEALDCVVSVDNTNIHLCGALGKPCLTMLPFRAEWRYGISGDRMPWYQSVKLFRQKYLDDWSNVLQEVNSELRLRTH